MRPRIPDLSGYREKLGIGPVSKLGQGLSPMSSKRIFRFLRPAWVVAAVAGILAAFFAGKATEGFLIDSLSETQRDMAKIVSTRPASIVIMQSQKKQGNEVAFTPFNVAEKAPDGGRDQPQPVLDSFALVGTLPNIGAWLSSGSETSLILKGQDYNGYTLQSIDTGEVLLAKGEDSFPLYLNLGGQPKPQNQASSPPIKLGSPTPGGAGVVRANEGRPGSIKKEIIDQLLMNPQDELTKMKLSPEGGGMKLMFAANDSLFSQLGMQEGDVLTSINGLPLDNMANVSNAIASLLNSSQFNLGLVRDSKPMQLDYAVK